MEKRVTVEFKDHKKVILTDEIGNTYTSKSEELIDFLHGSSKISFNIPDVDSLEFNKGYHKGYTDASREAAQEIKENYHPNDNYHQL